MTKGHILQSENDTKIQKDCCVLLAVNARYIHSSLSVWALQDAVAPRLGHLYTIAVEEATIHGANEEIVTRVAAHKPAVVGISTYIWNARKLEDILPLLRERLPGAVLVAGGPEASGNAAFWLAQKVDFIIQGQGEDSLALLLEALAGKTGFDGTKIPGLVYQKEGVLCEHTAPLSLKSWTGLTGDGYRKALGGRIAYIETSRGCPFQCAFCLSGTDDVHFIPLENAKKHILALSESDTQTIKFVDRTFNCHSNRAFDLFSYIISLETDCCFHFEVAADLFDERTIKLLAAAPVGRIQLEAGLQSFHDKTLASVSRKTDLHRVEKHLRALLAAGNIHIHMDLIAGLPYEDLDTFKEGFHRAYGLGAHTLQLGFLKLLHGSPLRQQARELGMVYETKAPYEIRYNPWLSEHDMKILRQAENALSHTYNKGRFLLSICHTLSAASCPPFDYYYRLGHALPAYGVKPEEFAVLIYETGLSLGVGEAELRDKLVCDWLGMTGGKNMPSFLHTQNKDRNRVFAYAKKHRGEGVKRCETAVLSTGEAVFVSENRRNRVTGLYPIVILPPL